MLLSVSAPRVLLSEQNALIHLGTSPDGLPLALSVVRERDPKGFVSSLARAVGQPAKGPYSDDLKRVSSDIRGILTAHALRERIWSDTSDPEEPLGVYVTNGEITGILGTSLMSKMLGNQSPLAPPASAARPKAPTEEHNTTVVRLAADDLESSGSTLRFHGPRRSCVSVSLGDGEPKLARFIGSKVPILDRPAIFESLDAFPDAAYRIHASRFEHRGPLSHVETYWGKMEEVTQQLPNKHIPGIEFVIDRREVAVCLLKLVRRLSDFHSREVEHGDFKPSNILITERTPILIDSLDVPAGERAPACTVGWCAPEQVIGKPVSPASDIFPVALLFCRLLNAVIYGRLVEYMIAVGEGKRRKASVFERPEVYLDRDDLPVPKEGLHDWQNLLQRCLSLEPGNRPANSHQLAEQLDALIREFPPRGKLEFDLGCPGEYARVLYPERGGVLTRIVEDRPFR